MSPYAIVPMLALIVLRAAVRRPSPAQPPSCRGCRPALGCLALVEVYYAAIVGAGGAAAAARPSAAAHAALAVRARRRGGVRRRRRSVLGPWMARNYALFGDAAPAQGTETKLLAERIVYSGPSAGELLVGLLLLASRYRRSVEPAPAGRDARASSTSITRAACCRKARASSRDATREGPGQRQRGPVPVSAPTCTSSAEPAEYAASSLLLTVRGLRATGGMLVLWGWLAVPLLLRRLRAQRGQGPFCWSPVRYRDCGGAGPADRQSSLDELRRWCSSTPTPSPAVTGGLELPIGLRRLMASRDGGEHLGRALSGSHQSGAWPAAARSAT